MSTSTLATFIFILILVALVIFGYWISTYLMKKATRDILAALKYREAFSESTAVYAEDVGINPGGMQLKLFRDYKPAAFQYLVKHNIVRLNENRLIYLSEEALAESGLADRIK